MTREILFRGKRIDNGEWVYGDLVQRASRICWFARDIFISAFDSESENYVEYRVGSRTVGQYTGINDINEKKIFEGDICKAYKKVRACKDFEFEGVVQYSTEIGAWELALTPFDSPMLCDYPECEITGSIHDNPNYSRKDKHDE